jgi:SAM-dependent methyltransferase
MRPDPAEIARYLFCPDDGVQLAPSTNGLQCTGCWREFRFVKPNLLEIMPSSPADVADMPDWYAEAYRKAYSWTWEGDEGLPQDAPELETSPTDKRRERQAEEALRLLQDVGSRLDGVFCDLSAGAGHTTFAAARYARLVFHCDLSVDAVQRASFRAARMGVVNIVAVRADYFRPPFRESVNQLTSLDSLIRGPWHELRLLSSIRQALAPGGCALVDFHNWWHNPVRRVGLLRQNFGRNRSYRRKQVEQLVKQAGITEFTVSGFFQEADPRNFPGKILRHLIPPTRLLVQWRVAKQPSKPQASPAHPGGAN